MRGWLRSSQSRASEDETVAPSHHPSQSHAPRAGAPTPHARASAHIRARASALLSHRGAVPAVLAVSLLLASPYLASGGSIDDYSHMIALRHAPELPLYKRAPWDLFAFAKPGDQ